MSMDIEYIDTATTPPTARELVPSSPNYNADWRVVSEMAGEVILANVTAPLDKPEKLRIAYSEINDVFKGSDVDPSDLATSGKKGVSVLVQNTGVCENDAGGSLEKFPYSVHLVIKVPVGAKPSAADVETVILRLLGHLYETGSNSTSGRIGSLIRGAMTPVDL